MFTGGLLKRTRHLALLFSDYFAAGFGIACST